MCTISIVFDGATDTFSEDNSDSPPPPPRTDRSKFGIENGRPGDELSSRGALVMNKIPHNLGLSTVGLAQRVKPLRRRKI